MKAYVTQRKLGHHQALFACNYSPALSPAPIGNKQPVRVLTSNRNLLSDQEANCITKSIRQMIADGEVRLEDLHEDPRFNLRTESEALEASISSLVEFIDNGSVIMAPLPGRNYAAKVSQYEILDRFQAFLSVVRISQETHNQWRERKAQERSS